MSTSEPATKHVSDMTQDELFSVLEHQLAIEPSFIKKAKEGDLDAQFTIASTYYDKRYALHTKAWCTKLAEKNHTRAQILLGTIFMEGIWEVNMDLDGDEAERWFLKACESDPANVAYEVAGIYARNENQREALKWYIRAGEHGHREAQYWAGRYLNSDDSDTIIEVDKLRALEWFQKSADQGHERAIEQVKRLNKEGYYSVEKMREAAGGQGKTSRKRRKIGSSNE